MYSTELFLQTLIAGVMIGVLYALMALGITFIYSIVKMINWAMGEFYMIGSYAQYLLVVYFLGPDLWYVAALLSATGVFLIGFALEPVLIKPMFRQALERQDEYATVVTISLLLLLRNPQKLIAKEELLNAVWADAAVEEGARHPEPQPRAVVLPAQAGADPGPYVVEGAVGQRDQLRTGHQAGGVVTGRRRGRAAGDPCAPAWCAGTRCSRGWPRSAVGPAR